ncbi:hypothetical protein MPSEU_000770700 [Mayamaea pseudoterrestris]|nr:hypothetical protein MPSEU_000770700 [Mayamaea pseudoterrestris]
MDRKQGPIINKREEQSRRRIRQNLACPSSYSSSSALLLLIFLLLDNLQRSNSFIYAGNETFESLPALFGRALPSNGIAFSARLQFLPEAPYLCEPLLNSSRTSFIIPPLLQETSHNANHHERQSYFEPVALLAARGDCPFIRKAVVAESLHPSIQYLIVYNSMQQQQVMNDMDYDNNYIQDEDELVPMYSEFGDSRLVMLSLSHRSGQALKRWMVSQPKQVRLNGGPRIKFDALPPNGMSSGGNSLATLSVKDLRNMIITALALLLTLVLVSGCLLMAAGSIGHVHVSGNRIVLTTTTTTSSMDSATLAAIDGSDATAVAAATTVIHHHYALGGSRRLLSESQVRQLAKDQQEATRYQVETIVLNSWARQREREHDADAAADGDAGEGDDIVNISLNASSHQTSTALDDTDQEHSCAICIDELYDFESSPEDALDYRIASSLLTLPCHHTFHLECVVPWLTERQSKCPLCKYDVFDFIMSQQLQRIHSRQVDGSDNNSEANDASPSRRRQGGGLSFLWNGIFGNYRRIGQQDDEGRAEREEAVQELEMATAQLRRTVDSGILT